MLNIVFSILSYTVLKNKQLSSCQHREHPPLDSELNPDFRTVLMLFFVLAYFSFPLPSLNGKCNLQNKAICEASGSRRREYHIHEHELPPWDS